MKRILLSLFLVTVIIALCAVRTDFPKPQGWVNDFAGVLSDNTKNELTNWFTEVKEKTDVEMAVAIFADIGGEDYSNFATDLYRAWGVGNKQDEGILLLLAVQERKIKFEVGYGSEPYLTDIYTHEAYQTMVSFLNKGSENYDEAVRQASLIILSRIASEKGVTLSGVPQYKGSAEPTESKTSNGLKLLGIAFFIFLMIITRGRILWWFLLFGGFGGGGRSGGGFGGFGGSGGGFGGFGGFGGGRSGGGGAGGGF